MSDFGQRLCEFRTKKSILQKEIGAAIGKDGTAVSRYEDDPKQLPIQLLEWLAAHDCNLNWLIVGEGPMLLADLAPAAAAEQGTPEKLAELEARLKALEEKDGKAATARKAKPKPAKGLICVTISSNLYNLSNLNENTDYEILDEDAHTLISVRCAASCRDAKSIPVALLERMFRIKKSKGYLIQNGERIPTTTLESIVQKLLNSDEVKRTIKTEIRRGLSDISKALGR